MGHRHVRPRAQPALLGHGNPNPLYYGEDRKGTNLYTASIIAIDADTGTLKWYHQFTPHDTHDWDSNHVPVLAELSIGGQMRTVVMVANRNGFFYVFDRANGKLLVGKPFSDTTWARELDGNGHPIVLNDGSKGCLPDQWGSTNHMPPSFDPGRRLFFVTARETCAEYPASEGRDRSGPDLEQRHRAARRRSQLRRVASDRSPRRRAAMGVQGIRRRRWRA